MAFQGDTQGQLQDFVKILKRRVPQVLLVTAFVTTLGVCVAVLIPKKYVAEQRVELLPTRVQSDPYLRNPGSTSVTTEVSNAQYHLKHGARVEQVLEELDWEEFATLTEDRQDYVRMVVKNIDVKVLEKRRNEGSTFVDVAYADIKPRRAMLFLKRLIEVWIDDVVERDRVLLEEELKQAQNDRDAIAKVHREKAEERRRLQRELGIPSVEPGVPQPINDAVYEELTRIHAEQEQLREELAADRAQLQSRREDLDSTPARLARGSSAAPSATSKVVEQLQAEIAQKRLLLLKFKPAHSAYRRTEQEIQSLTEQLELAARSVPELEPVVQYEVNPARVKLQEEVDQLEARIQRNETLLAELDKKEGRYEQLHEERLELFKELYLLNGELVSLQKQRVDADAQYTQKNSAYQALRRASGVPFKIADRWVVPKDPSSPNVYLIVTFSVIAGLALGLVLAFLGEFTKNCYRSVNDVSRVMTAPVLGIINTIVTRREVRRTRLRRLVITASSFAIMGGVGWLTWAFTSAPNLLGTELVQTIEDVRMMFR